MLKEREDQKKKEYEARAALDVRSIEGENFTKEEALDMRHADSAYLYNKDPESEDQGDDLEQKLKEYTQESAP